MRSYADFYTEREHRIFGPGLAKLIRDELAKLPSEPVDMTTSEGEIAFLLKRLLIEEGECFATHEEDYDEDCNLTPRPLLLSIDGTIDCGRVARRLLAALRGERRSRAT